MNLIDSEPLKNEVDSLQFEDIFDLIEIQQIQDLFSETNGVASIITKPDGSPITKPSNFCNLCSNIIRKTDKGLANCYASDSIIGKFNPSGPTIKPCMSVGLMDAGASICIDGKHIANWLIGQVRTEELDEDKLIKYAGKIGANKNDFINALKEVPVIPIKQFKKISNLLYAFANQLSEKAYINWQHKKQITVLQEKARQLQESEYFFKATQRAAMVGSFKVDYENKCWVSSEVFDMILGIDKEYDRSIRYWLELIHPEDREMMATYLQNEIKLKKQCFNKEYRIVRKNDDKTRWVLGLGLASFDAEGNINSFSGTIQDITKSKFSEILIQEKTNEIEAQNEEYKQINEDLHKANNYLELSKETFRMLFESINDAVFISEISSETKRVKFVKVNNIACQLLGYTKEELLSKSPTDINSEKTKPSVTSKINETVRNGQLIMEVEYLKKNGQPVPAEISSRIFQLEGKTYIHTIARDITKRKHSEKELIKAKEKAEESDRLKTAFLQNMSHEIRTPMNAILGFTDLLVSNQGNKDKVDLYSKIITQSGRDLSNIIEDILDIAKIESGQLPINLEKFSLHSILGELELFFSEHQITLNKKHIKFKLRAQCDPLRSYILTDKVKLKQIFINLIGNAFKYTDHGLIDGGCHIDESNNLIFYVSDTGIGIPANKQQVIFDRFVQIEPGKKRLYGGKGLGLSITKGLIELLGGRIWLESEEGKGTIFYFTIPLIQVTEPSPDAVVQERM